MKGGLLEWSNRMVAFGQGLARAQRELLQRRQDMEQAKARDRQLPRDGRND